MEDPRWPQTVVLLDAIRAQLARLEFVIDDDPDYLLTLIERRADVAELAALVFDPNSPDGRNEP